MNLTRNLQAYVKDNLVLEDVLPTKMPVYVNSVAYLFGVCTLSALAMLLLTGLIMAIFGPGWYHISRAGRFFNSLHFWSAQLFFFFILLHLATKFFLGAWRDGRWKTWMIGVTTFGFGVFAGFTGYLSATNWSAQWHAVEGKDAMNALGIGAFFSTTNYSQVLTLHMALFPTLIVVLVAVHLSFIRHESPVKPYPAGGGPKK